MHIDECRFAMRLGRWVPVLPVEPPGAKHVDRVCAHPLLDELGRILNPLVPGIAQAEVRGPSYEHTYPFRYWGWHHDTFVTLTWLLVWSTIDPTDFRIAATGEVLTGVEPYDIVIASRALIEHRGPEHDSGNRWFARAYTNTFDIQRVKAKYEAMDYPLLRDPELPHLSHCCLQVLRTNSVPAHPVR